MKRIIKMVFALWPFYIVIVIVIGLIWALSQKPTITESYTYPPSPAKIATKTEEAERIDAKFMAKEFVEERLKAPSTAKFQSEFDFSATKNKKGQWQVLGYVDAQNSFGAMLRNKFICTMKKKADKWYLVKLDMWN